MSLTVSPERVVAESSSPLLATPDSWSRRPLGSVARVLNGFAFSSKRFVSAGGTPLIRIRDLLNDRTVVGYMGEHDIRYVVHPGDLLVGMDGDFHCARWRGPSGLLNQRVCKISPDPEQLDADYLTHLLPAYLKAIHDFTSSTTVTHLSSRDIARIPIPVPPLREQRSVARFLDTAKSAQHSVAGHLARAREAIRRFRQAVLVSACTGQLTAEWRDQASGLRETNLSGLLTAVRSERPRRRSESNSHYPPPGVPIPSTWSWVRLSDLSSSIEYGYTAPSTMDPVGPHMLRITDVQQESVDWSNVPYCRIDPAVEHRYRIVQGDLLFARTGATTGKSYLIREDPPSAVFASYLIRVRLHPRMNPEYIYAFFRSLLYWTQISQVSSGTGQPNVNGTKLADLWVPVPGEDEQGEIVQKVNRLLARADHMGICINFMGSEVGLTVPAIMAKVLRGDLEVVCVERPS